MDDEPDIPGGGNGARPPGLNRADDDVVQNFQLESSYLRGRAVRIGPVLDEVLAAHNYPEPVARLVAETMTLAALLSSMLKYEGIFTLQTKGDGPVSMLVADVTSAGEIRACAHFDRDKYAGMEKRVGGDVPDIAQCLGKGYIAFTVDQGKHADLYQGIVELKGASLVECVQHYFGQSEQIRTGIKVAVGRRGQQWRGGAIMLQRMPGEQKGPRAVANDDHEEDWRRAMILMGTCTEDELLNPHLHSNALLDRLFHEEGVRVYRPGELRKGCRCDSDKVRGIISMMSDEDIDYVTVDGRIVMHCEFCSRDFVFDPAEIRSKIGRDDVSIPPEQLS